MTVIIPFQATYAQIVMFQGEMVSRLLTFIFFFLPTTAYTNVVWPVIDLETRLWSWWAISVGLFVDFFFIKWIFTLPTQKTSIATLSANTIYAVAGIILITLTGIIWELFPDSAINWVCSCGIFNPITWGATFVFGYLANGLLEGAVYEKWFFP